MSTDSAANAAPPPHTNWQAAGDIDVAASLSSHLSCPPAIVRILAARGIDTPAAADAFFNPTLADLLEDPATDPFQMLGMSAAVKRILAAIQQQQSILIYGDYDVDGTTATALLKTAIERTGLALEPQKPQQVAYHVPHRIREGYGMRNAILAEAAQSGVRLVISVDTGIRAVAEAVEARALGLDLIVTDHHLPDADANAEAGAASPLPDCVAVINPNQPGCPYPNKHLCGAAVAFKLAHALLIAAAPLTPDPAAFTTRVRTILLPSFLKLAAIATIADSVPLTGENRAIAALGLAALARPVQPGLRALMQFAKIPHDRAPTATEVGFRIAPRINAAGRMDIASDVVELLLTRDLSRAHTLAEKLDALNQDRRASEASALESIENSLTTLLDGGGEYPSGCIILDHPDWHRGVLGILASRVVDRTGRPALVLTHADGDAHGSGRSIAGFHLLDAIAAAHAEDPAEPLFHRFGGHAHAVGFSLPSSSLPLLRDRIAAYAAARLTPSVLVPSVEYDAEIAFADITPELFHWIGRCVPFGIGNREPVFRTSGLTLAAPVRVINQRHICLQLTHCAEAGPDPAPAPAISALGWSRGSTDWPALCNRLDLSAGSRVDILYRIRKNTGPYATAAFDGLELELCALRPYRSIPASSPAPIAEL